MNERAAEQPDHGMAAAIATAATAPRTTAAAPLQYARMTRACMAAVSLHYCCNSEAIATILLLRTTATAASEDTSAVTSSYSAVTIDDEPVQHPIPATSAIDGQLPVALTA